MHRCAAFVLILLSFLSGCRATDPALQTAPATSRSANPPPSKVVILVIDGLRYSESFADPTHAHVPRLWNDLRPLGTMVDNFRNEGDTRTAPGHTSLLSGTWQYIANDGSERPDMPMLFEYYRTAYGVPQSDTYVVSGKTKLNVCTYSSHPSYGAPVGAAQDTGWIGDVAVYNELISVLQTQQPYLVLAALPDVDLTGHSGVWADYLAAIERADSLAKECWDYLQSDPFYANQTYLLITNDHGRHDDANGGFRSHGDRCDGCERILFLALGPDIRANYVASGVYTLRDICPTVARILDFEVPLSLGTSMDDIFEPTLTGIPRP